MANIMHNTEAKKASPPRAQAGAVTSFRKTPQKLAPVAPEDLGKLIYDERRIVMLKSKLDTLEK